MQIERGATILDAAFHLDNNSSVKIAGANVNKKVVPLNYVLKNGDQVQVSYSDKVQASKLWMRFLNTQKAKDTLLSYL